MPSDITNGIPPQNLDAEMSVIASVFLNSDRLDELGDLRPEQFYADRNEKLWRVVLECRDARIGIDPVTIGEHLERRGWLSEIGGLEYIGNVVEAVPNSAHARYYADIVISKWRSRQVLYACQELREAIQDGAADEDIAKLAETKLAEIAERAVNVADVAMSDVLRDAWNEIQKRSSSRESFGIPTGFTDLDRIIVGIEPTDLIVIAARPAIGKSAFAGKLVANFAGRGLKCLFLSLEMSRLEFAMRLLSMESRIDGSRIKEPHCLSEMERDAIMVASGTLSRLPIRIDETGDQRVSTIAAQCRRMKREHGLDILVIDYLQLIRSDVKVSVREQEVASITRALKGLAKELSIPVIVLAQLNRAVEMREDKRPRLADLRESGAIEQDANQVWMLHRPSAYDPKDRPGECEVIVSKNRNGKTGIATLTFLPSTSDFKDFVSVEYAGAEAAARAFNPPDWVK